MHQNKLQIVIDQIIVAKNKFCRQQDEIKLIAVSKTRSADEIKAMYNQGQTAFGENYVQEALDKQQHLQDCQIEWHFIGQFQSNKAKYIARHFDWLQTLYSTKQAAKLENFRCEIGRPLNVLIQINLQQESTKAGIQTSSEIFSLADNLRQYPHLKLRGLMAIPANESDVDKQREQFADLYRCYQLLQQHHDDIDTLSMGMSGDFAEAIGQGSTMVRIGTKLFGARHAD